MKTNILIIVIVLVLGVSAVGAYFIFAKRPSEEGSLQKSETFFVSGDVMIKKGPGAAWKSVDRDMQIEDGDLLTTSDDSSVEIKFGQEQNNVIAVRGNTAIELKRIEREGDKAIDLKKGELLSFIEGLDPESKFEVKTPTAVCGVMGTGFETYAKQDVTVVKVYQGQVNVKGVHAIGILPTKEVVVKGGNQVRVEKSKTPEEPTPLSEEDLQRWNSWKGELTSHLFRTFNVFFDEDDPKNHYNPSGWVGDYDAIRRVSWEENPHSGKNCLRFRYTGRTPQGAGWAGVYWQNPVNNWGDVKGGYNLDGAKKLTFWARGEKGGEIIVRFGIGGIGGIYPDSSKTEMGPIVLEKEWRQYSLDLSDKDISYISGGFYWMTDKTSNPDGAMFYIDDIKYE